MMSTPAPSTAVAAFSVTFGNTTMDVYRIETPATAPVTAPIDPTAVTTKVAVAVQQSKAPAPTPQTWWEMYAALHYIETQTPGLLYRERFQGTYEQVLAKAQGRIKELDDIRSRHSAIHVRVNDMSAGKP